MDEKAKKNFFHHIDGKKGKKKNYNREFFNKIQHKKKLYNKKELKLIDKRNETVFFVVAGFYEL